MKFKSKISYLGERISILPWQMAEQLAVEVDVKNVMDGTIQNTEHGTQTSSFIWLGLMLTFITAENISDKMLAPVYDS